MKNLLSFLIVCSLLLISVLPVYAEETTECTTTTGSYGQTNTSCRVLGITHEPVKAGVGDVSFLLIAEILSVVGLGAYGLAKLAERTYWFD